MTVSKIEILAPLLCDKSSVLSGSEQTVSPDRDAEADNYEIVTSN